MGLLLTGRRTVLIACLVLVTAACGGGRNAADTSGTSASQGPWATSSSTMPSQSVSAADCRLSRLTGWGENSLGFPRRPNAIPTTGTVKFPVVMVDFPDAVAAMTPQAAFSLVSPGAEQYFAAASQGQMNLVLTPTLRWDRMSKPSNEYGMTRSSISRDSHGTYLREALTLAADKLDFSNADGALVLVDPGVTNFDFNATYISPPGLATVIIHGHSIPNAVTSGNDTPHWGPKWLNHEMSHAAGLVDLYDMHPDTVQHQFHWVGDFSLMGNVAGKAPTFFAWESWLLGWLGDDQISCLPTGTTDATLTPVEDGGGLKAVIAPTGKTTAVVVESRRAKGLDSDLPREGALVYLVSTDTGNGGGGIKVLPLDDSDQSKISKLLSVGQSVTYQGVTVTLKGSDDGHDVITVTRA